MADDRPAAFDRYGPEEPRSPVILSVPHAGRDYPSAMLPMLRIPPAGLAALEDRHIDAVAQAARGSETMLVARVPRAWIDLNRSERERDPGFDDDAARAGPPMMSAKLRGGLGLVPRRVPGRGDIWLGRLSRGEVDLRITTVHRPYHAALAALLAAARARFGIAVLVDIHSMPPLGHPQSVPRIVIGNRHGQSADARFVSAVDGAAGRAGLCAAINAPYAGGHIVERHGRPRAGIHALQLEFDRSLYLDPTLDHPAGGLAPTAAVLRAMIAAVTQAALAQPTAIAAE